ncbi:trehalose-phosphatase [Brevibacterium luteolum]|uniref:Trehalose-phosphatase n=1 Tax=Brevibacterium luteolum TaxID=199591 RepID=A0A849AS26_9MICO|nr:trehalose-phosphatase [Brevibacterium luteolum]MBM7529968.1 trehalose 6-phosphate phosphatase [Brevibacterium luteolum]NNG78720.1 trehalose-phosphatase [Brevibacterium luteolum]
MTASLDLLDSWDPAAPTSGPLGDLAEAARTLDAELFAEIVRLARTPKLLIATDYDGTIAPIVDKPTHAYPLPISLISMRALAALPDTNAAVISGRSLRDLAAMSRLPREVHLVGSHGSETDIDAIDALDAEAKAALKDLQQSVASLARMVPEAQFELKPTGVAVHLRGLDPDARAVVEAGITQMARHVAVSVVRGKEVADLTVVESTKGEALNGLRERLGAAAVVYIGDDTSDERALETLTSTDLGITVAPLDCRKAVSGRPCVDTAAGFQLADPETVSLVLSSIFELRRSWLFGQTAVPIERHSILANGQSTALIDPGGRICWMPHPLPHSASLFSEILGSPAAGYYSVAPATASGADARKQKSLTQRYQRDTTIVETRWAGLTARDYLAPVSEDSLDTVLVRVLTGDAEAEIRFAPRPDFGSYPIRLEKVGDGVRVLGTSEPVMLHAPGVDFDIISEDGSDTAVARVVPTTQERAKLVLVLVCGGSFADTDYLLAGGESFVRRRAAGYWRNWVTGLTLPELKTDEVTRSAITLRALCHVPTGGVLAAATSSLPEGIGGIRNWDYRYCWLRDGSMTVRTLLSLGSTAEAEGFLAWLAGILEMTVGPEQLHPLYAVDGSALTTEAVLEHLPGYAGSRPVRVGNAAEHQVQLDVFGPVTELLDDFTAAVGTLSEENWKLTCDMVTAVERRWHEPDHGIWEARRAPKHNVYTKVMCWVTVDRAIRIAERFGRTMPGAWRRLRETIAEDVITRGWNEKVGAYTVAYGEDDLDAACLFVGLSGLLPADDERFIATVDAIERDLRVGPTVFRYHYDDGLPGLEGGFHICTTWLIEAFIKVGRIADARDLFRRLDNLMGPTGLFPEEYEPIAEQHLGNHPQAYSHLGYIRVAQQLDELLDVASDAELDDDGLDEVDIDTTASGPVSSVSS